MRIALLTHHWVPNFGANLQALSTYALLSKLGNDVVVLNYRPKSLEDYYLPIVPTEQMAAHDQHSDTYLSQSPVFRREEEIAEFCNDCGFDIIVVGSDAVFHLAKKARTEHLQFPNPFWMTWASSRLKPRPRICCLAGSAMGTNYYAFPGKVRRGIRRALQQMDYISVRDRWTRWMFAGLSWGECWPRICPDPVSVLNEVFEVPKSYTREPAMFHRKYILLTVQPRKFSEEWAREFVSIAHDRGLQVFGLPRPEGEPEVPLDRTLPLPLSPLAWYAWIQHAAGLVGSWFHPAACSIFNDVPFVNIDTYSRRYYRIHIRIVSKAHDICRNIGGRSRCIMSTDVHKFSPQKAFDLLQSWKSERVKRYALQASRNFAETVDEILAASHDAPAVRLLTSCHRRHEGPGR